MKVPDVDKVPAVSRSFHNLGITNWIEGSRDAMNEEGYEFVSFMKDLRENFLESRWVCKIYHAQIKWLMATNEHFIKYVNQIIYYN